MERFDTNGRVETVKFVSRNVVLATGGKQKSPLSLTLKKLDVNPKVQKVYTSDEMLRDRGFR